MSLQQLRPQLQLHNINPVKILQSWRYFAVPQHKQRIMHVPCTVEPVNMNIKNALYIGNPIILIAD